MIIKTRSATAAQKIADERGLAEGSYTIEKVATAKYELTINPDNGDNGLAIDEAVDAGRDWPSNSDDMTLSQIADTIEAGGEQVDHDSSVVAKPKPAKAVRVNRHWNDDGSLTLYVAGIKLRRIGGDEDEEVEDAEEFSETYLNKKYLKKNGGWVWGRTTQGHNWHTKRQKALRARIAAGLEAGEDVSALEAELAKIGGK